MNYYVFDDPREKHCAMPSTALSGGSPAEAERLSVAETPGRDELQKCARARGGLLQRTKTVRAGPRAATPANRANR
jgi:hypothetical protein